MTIDVSPVPLEDVLPLRELYRREMNCQIVHDSLPGRGFGDLFLIRVGGRVAVDGSVMGDRGESRDIIQEFYESGNRRTSDPYRSCGSREVTMLVQVQVRAPDRRHAGTLRWRRRRRPGL
jgi:hypothetical protein